jgi:DNA modification methylase
MTVRILQGDCRDVLKTLPDESVHCVVTSPPYFGLRDYGVDGQIGLEDSPQAFVSALVAVMSDVRRVLREDGTCWLNIGDSYAGSWGAQSRPQGATGQMADRSVISARQIQMRVLIACEFSGTGAPGLPRSGYDAWSPATCCRPRMGARSTFSRTS